MEGFCGGVWQQVGSACIGAAGARAASKRPGATEPPGKRAHHRGCVHGSRRNARLGRFVPARRAGARAGQRARQVLRRRVCSETRKNTRARALARPSARSTRKDKRGESATRKGTRSPRRLLPAMHAADSGPARLSCRLSACHTKSGTALHLGEAPPRPARPARASRAAPGRLRRAWQPSAIARAAGVSGI